MNDSYDSGTADWAQAVRFFCVVILTAMAAGMGWGIRGQYGHESGAMLAGVLAGLTLVMLVLPSASSLFAARAAAMMAVGIGIGGSMTYGQTIGLTQDNNLIGHWGALAWGLIGLATKGGIWIGFGGLFLGMGLSRTRYRTLEIAAIMLAGLGVMWLGIWLLNQPYNVAERQLPLIYFSDSWFFEPDAESLRPRRETWGGLLLALLSLAGYARFVRGDQLAGRLTVWAMLGGAFGFSGGQCVQAFHAWNPAVFQEGGLLGAYHETFALFNWWNMMETTFGLIWGSVLATGLWRNRSLIDEAGAFDASAASDTAEAYDAEPDDSLLTFDQLDALDRPAWYTRMGWELTALAIHIVLLVTSEFLEVQPLVEQEATTSPAWLAWLIPNWETYTEYGLLMSAIPLMFIVRGRIWPYMMLLPVVAIPIAGKTVRALCYDAGRPPEQLLPGGNGWLYCVCLPLMVMFVGAVWLCLRDQRRSARGFAAVALLLSVACYFGLNTVMFDYAWPWRDDWTGRTPNQTIFLVCAACLALSAIVSLVVARGDGDYEA